MGPPYLMLLKPTASGELKQGTGRKKKKVLKKKKTHCPDLEKKEKEIKE